MIIMVTLKITITAYMSPIRDYRHANHIEWLFLRAFLRFKQQAHYASLAASRHTSHPACAVRAA